MDQYDYLTRDQLISLVRALGVDRGEGREPVSDNPDGLPEFGERAMRDFGKSSSPMRIFDRETLQYLAVNDAAVKFYGYSREEFLALTIRDTRHPEEHAAQLASLERSASYFQHGGSRRQIKRSGEVVVVELVTQDVFFNGRKARLALTIDITGRLRMQELLWRRQQEFESLAENLPDLVARYDRERRFLYANSAIEGALGLDRGQIIGRTQREVGLPGDLISIYDTSLSGVFATGQPHKVEFRLALASGERQFEAYHVPELNAAGAIGSVLCVARDITEHKRAEDDLKGQQQILDAVIDNLPVGVFIRDAKTHRYLRRNRFAQERFGPRNESSVGKAPHEIFSREQADQFVESDLRLFETGRMQEIPEQQVIDLGTGITRIQHLRKVPLYDENDEPWLVVGVADDITERKGERDLQNRLAAIVSHSRDAVISKDLDGIIRTWNPAAERLFGYSADEAIGRPIAMLIPQGRQEEDTVILERVRAGLPVEAVESVRLRKDGTPVDVSLSISPIMDSEGRVIGASQIARDITERRQNELAILRGASLARLLESLARAANQALTPEDAMVACLERICRHGHWALGRVELFDRGRPPEAVGRSIWYAPDRDRFAEFIRFSTGRAHSGVGVFIGRLLREQTAVWLEDLKTRSGFVRWESAIAHGLHSAFAFPVIVRGELVAIMELFSDEVRAPDPHIMGAAHSLASQLARIVEREWAHQANARMAAIVASSHDAIVSRTLDGVILTWNRAAERLFGYTAEEIMGRNIEILYPDELKPDISRRQRILMEGRELPPSETVRLAKDGRRVHVSTSPAAILDSSGNICGVSTIIQDITQRKVAEQALRESERRLAADLDAMTRLQRIGSLYVRERKMHAVLDEIVDAATAIAGADMGNIQVLDTRTGRLRIIAQRGFGKSWLDFWNDVPAASGSCGAALEQRSRVLVEDVSLSPIFVGTDALQVQLEAGVRAVQSTPLLSRSGQLIGMFSTHWKVPHRPDDRVLRLLDLLARQTADIIEWTDAEMALARSEERFRQLAENIDQVFWIDTPACDRNLYVSPAFERVWGRSIESLRREPNSWLDAVHSEDRARLHAAVQGIVRGHHLDVEYRVVRPDGTVRWIRDRSYPMQGDGETPLICGIAEDITARKLAEQQRLSQEIHQRDALVREVHHRIKNSLQGVAGLLRQKARKFPAIAPDIEEAVMQLQTVAMVYGLQGTRADGLLSVSEMVEAICVSAEGLLGGRVDRTFERKSPRPACLSGSEAVSTAVALNELVFNALKHQSAPAGKKRAQVMLCETRNAAEIRIVNRGRLPKRFDFSLGRGLGTGLGLVRTLLASPGASVEFFGKGSNVEVMVTLRPPSLAERGGGIVKRTGHHESGKEKAAAAYPGRG
jgi:PAS domain S-box-containing protein